MWDSHIVLRRAFKNNKVLVMPGREVIIKSGVVISSDELKFVFSRSGGPGGQNVNKVASRVTLMFSVNESTSLSDKQKKQIVSELRSQMSADGTLTVNVQESRSQYRNREIAVEKLSAMLRTALTPRKKRIATRVPSGAKRDRVDSKKRRSRTKKLRGRAFPDE
jgi:ribosome-associated protein